jgi:alpha-tubulin suppressor-like RCC1 family protein
LIHEIIVYIRCGRSFSLVLSKSGNLYGFGYKRCGHIGRGNAINQLTPIIRTDTKIKEIALNRSRIFLVAKDDNDYCYA